MFNEWLLLLPLTIHFDFGYKVVDFICKGDTCLRKLIYIVIPSQENELRALLIA